MERLVAAGIPAARVRSHFYGERNMTLNSARAYSKATDIPLFEIVAAASKDMAREEVDA